MPRKVPVETTDRLSKKEKTTQNGGRKLTPQKPRAKSGSKMADLKSKPDHYLECREMRHAYTRIGYFHWNDKGMRAICRIGVCQRCGTVRLGYFYASGKLMDSRYEYPDHYLLIGDGKITQADVILESMRRVGIAADRDSVVADSPSRKLRLVGT